jgi:hypothetical protein
MLDLPPDDPNVPLRWTDKILKTASRIDKATTGALTAAAFSAIPLGIAFGTLGWVPFLGFTGALVYRGIKGLSKNNLIISFRRSHAVQSYSSILATPDEASD